MIEEVDDLAEWLADAAQVWGSCPDSEQASCERETYCRLCWTIEVKKRMRPPCTTKPSGRTRGPGARRNDGL